jgi:hypothetical protein
LRGNSKKEKIDPLLWFAQSLLLSLLKYLLTATDLIRLQNCKASALVVLKASAKFPGKHLNAVEDGEASHKEFPWRSPI